MLVGGIPAWRLPRDVVKREIGDYFAALGVKFHLNTRIGRDIPLAELMREYDAVYLAAGTQTPQQLDIPGERLALVYSGLAFMDQVNLASTPPSIGRRVAVIGGGFTAMDCSRSALRLGAEHVYVLYRRTKVEMPVDEYELEDAEVERVDFQYLVSPVAVTDNGKGAVGGLVCVRNGLGEPDGSGRRRPIPIEGSEFQLDVDTVIAATGQVSDLSWLQAGAAIPARDGRPVVDANTWMTRVPGLFAGGDFTAGARNVISAIADGHLVAASIDRYLLGQPRRRQSFQLTPLVPYVMAPDYTELSRVKMPALTPEGRWDAAKGAALNLANEVETGYTPALACIEARRCLLCHRNVTIDPDLCVLCSRCVEYCPYDCIKLVPFGALEDAGGVNDLAQTRLGKPLDLYRRNGKDSRDPYEEGQAFIMDEDYCIRCGICEAVCPTGALQMKLFELEEVSA
jgi:thioredoxin reductase/NAD-dependent dihydropyrimidine dehydrogenase PreA subunit